jgi:hypothetical protein
MNPIAVTVATTVQLAPLCPVPYAWAAYFLDSNSLFDAWRIRCSLIATLYTPDYRDRALPSANWLGAACVKKCGLAAGD